MHSKTVGQPALVYISNIWICTVGQWLKWVISGGKTPFILLQSASPVRSGANLAPPTILLHFMGKPSVRICNPAYSEPLPEPRNREGCSREGIRCKKYLGVHGWAYSDSRLCGCCRPDSGHTVRGVSDSGPVIDQGRHQIQH